MAEKKCHMEKKKQKEKTGRSKTKTVNFTKRGAMKKNMKPTKDGRSSKSGPHLPSSLLKEIGYQRPMPNSSDQVEGDEESEDLYEYEEALPEEETKENRRFDPVENYEYEFPEEFEDEDVLSDEDDDGEEKEDEKEYEKHARMLQSITGLPSEAFKDKRKKDVISSDVWGEFGGENNCISEMLDSIRGKAHYSMLRKRLHHSEKNSMAVYPPLPKVEKEKLERKVTYVESKKEITKWEPLVKRNREAPTLYLGEDKDLGVHTIGTITAEYEPRTEFEKKMAAIIGVPEIVEAHRNDGFKILELNKVSVEDVRVRQNHLAKMHNLLFRHEMRAKRIKNIKSKTYHRMLKKDRRKAALANIDVDPEAAKKLAIKQEFKRAEERMTLKHKNSSKWAKRILKRGFKAQDEGTRTALADQLQQHALLTRKINSMNESNSDESSDDDSIELSPGVDGVSRLLNKAKEKTIKVMEEEDEIPKSGVFALPFMERGLKKQKESASEEARLALQEYESSLGKLEGDKTDPSTNERSGRRVFGAKSHPVKPIIEDSINRNNSDSEGDFEVRVAEDAQNVEHGSHDLQIRSALAPDDNVETGQEIIYKEFGDFVKNPESKTTYEVAIVSSNPREEMSCKFNVENANLKSAVPNNIDLPSQDPAGGEEISDSDSELEMVDGFLSFDKLPSQEDLIRRAYAVGDVENEFEEEKMNVLNEENPEPEKPALLPGWGQWTHIQKRKGIPSFMKEEHDRAIRKREEALKTRKDAHLKHVIISEKIDKKAEKLHAKTLPFPYTSKEVYEQSIRMPVGPDYNPAISIGALNRPAIIKRAGVIIKPIKYEDVDPHGKFEEPKDRKKSIHKAKAKKAKLVGSKVSNKV